MLMRRFGSTPSHRFKLKLHTAPAAGRLENSWKFTQGMDTSRLHPRSLSVLSLSVPSIEVATFTPSRLNRLKNTRRDGVKARRGALHFVLRNWRRGAWLGPKRAG